MSAAPKPLHMVASTNGAAENAHVLSQRSHRPDVLLLRDVPEERRFSMERFANGLERAFENGPSLDIRSMTFHQSSRAKKMKFGKLDRYAVRFIRYPLALQDRRARLYHIIDHGYADLARVLPPERTVVTCHDLMLLRAEEGDLGFRGRRSGVMRFRWSTSYLRNVARVACDSESTRRDVIRLRHVPESRTVVIPLGIDDHFRVFGSKEQAKSRFRPLERWTYTVLHVSTGNPYKNIDQTLRVLAALRNGGMNVCLARAGRPLNRDETSYARDLRVGDSIVELGFVSDLELAELYRAADVLLFPSHYEGFGWPPLEAMASGTPVVTSHTPALLEVVADVGLTAPADDTKGLADAVRAVLQNEDIRMTMSARGLIRAKQYTWERTRHAYEHLYLDVLSTATTRPTHGEEFVG